jgi:hypothetical protein
MHSAIEEDRLAWLTRGRSRPDSLSSSAAGTPLDLSYISKAFGLTLDKAELIVAAFTRCATRSARDSHQRRFFPDGIAFDGNRFNRTAVTTPLFEYLARATSVGVSWSGSGAPARNHHGPEPQWTLTFAIWNHLRALLLHIQALRQTA